MRQASLTSPVPRCFATPNSDSTESEHTGIPRSANPSVSVTTSCFFIHVSKPPRTDGETGTSSIKASHSSKVRVLSPTLFLGWTGNLRSRPASRWNRRIKNPHDGSASGLRRNLSAGVPSFGMCFITRSAHETSRWRFMNLALIETLGGARKARIVCLSFLDTLPHSAMKISNNGSSAYSFFRRLAATWRYRQRMGYLSPVLSRASPLWRGPFRHPLKTRRDDRRHGSPFAGNRPPPLPSRLGIPRRRCNEHPAILARGPFENGDRRGWQAGPISFPIQARYRYP